MLNRIVTAIEWGVVCITFPLASLLAFLQVAIRWVSKFDPEFVNNYTFSILQWSPELINHLLIWGALFGASMGVRSNTHIGVDVLVKKFPKNISHGIVIFTQLLTAAFLLYTAYNAYLFVSSDTKLPDFLPGMNWMYHSPLVLALILITYRYMEKMGSTIKGGVK